MSTSKPAEAKAVPSAKSDGKTSGQGDGSKEAEKPKADGKQGGGTGKPKAKPAGKAPPPPETKVVEIRPMATEAKMRKRHWGVLLSFFLLVVAPIAATAYYLFNVAIDQYASNSGFSVRSEETASPAAIAGSLGTILGGGGDGEAEMLFEFIQSQDLVAALDAKLGLTEHYSSRYEDDPLFSLRPGGTIEDLVDYWNRIIKISYDQSTRLLSLHVRAFTPEMAQELSEAIIAESQVLVNELNAKARSDVLKHSEQDLADAVARLKVSREAMVRFRTRTQIVDPEADLQGRMGVLASLQQQLAQALIDYDIVALETNIDDPRAISASRRIDVIQERIRQERDTFSNDEQGQGSDAYPALLAEYESLLVDREYAEGAYAASLAALDIARANAARQSRYLATFIKPTTPQKAEYPKRTTILSLAAIFFLMFWSIGTLMYYALKDRK